MKGLKTVLLKEQLKPKPDAIRRDGSSQGDTGTTTDAVTTDEKSEADKLKETLMSLFPAFYVYTLKNGKSVRFDVKDVNKDEVVNYIIQNTPDNEEVDDRFIHGLVAYIISNGGKPFYFTYSKGGGKDISKNVINVDSLVESKKIGLKSILLNENYLMEQMAGTEVVYIFAPDSDTGVIDYKFYKGPYAKNKVSRLYNAEMAKATANGGDNAKANTTPEVDPKLPTPPPPPPKPAEDELNITPKIEMIQKKAEQSGVESIMKNLNPEQQRVLKNYTNQDWSTLKPANQDMDVYDVINLKDDETSFKDFKTFPLYRPKRMTENNLNAYAGLLDSQNVERQMCKATAKIYYDGAKARKRLSDNAKKQMADYLTACNYQIKNYMDLGKTKEYFAAFENDLDEVPSFIINYSARTVGGNKF